MEGHFIPPYLQYRARTIIYIFLYEHFELLLTVLFPESDVYIYV